MRKGLSIGLVSGALLALVAHWTFSARIARTEADERLVQGAGEAGMLDERMAYTDEKGHVTKRSVRRVLVKVPRSYGRMVSAAASETSNVLWFASDDGTLRNVVLGGGVLFQVEAQQE